ncbi:MAG: hypothetical protein KC912_16985 [Proteobacteria bacterium]|nr:hypothetical protein [Pseudomonadota bacterium]
MSIDDWKQVAPSLDIRLAFRCPVPWDAMTVSGEGVRHCDTCDRAVFDLLGRGRTEIAALIEEHGEDLCGRARVREDGRLTFGRCASGPIMRGRIVAR